MNSTTVDPRTIIDGEHIRLLAIFHFVAAGLGAVGVAFSLLYFVMFQVFFSSPELWAQSPEGPPPAAMMGIFRWFLSLSLIWFSVAAVGNLLSGLFLRARRHRTFSLVVAGVNCLHIPIGTALGVFTFVVLLRASVGKLYETPP